MVPEPCSPSPVLQEFSKEERDPVKTHEGWGVMLPCNPPAHYPGKWGSWATARGGAAPERTFRCWREERQDRRW